MMVKFKFQLIAVLFFLGLSGLLAQDDFNTCSAIYLGEQRVVDEYSPLGKCRIDNNAEGLISLREIIDEGYNKELLIPFKVAIKEKRTNTMVMFSEESYKQLNVQEVLKKCGKGDRFVVLPAGTKWAVPHHEVLVE